MAIITIRIEEEAREISIIEEAEVVEDQVVNLHNLVHSIISNKVNPVLVVQNQIGQFVNFVEKLVIWLWTATIGWTMPIKASIHLQSLQQWLLPSMPPPLKINLGLLTV